MRGADWLSRLIDASIYPPAPTTPSAFDYLNAPTQNPIPAGNRGELNALYDRGQRMRRPVEDPFTAPRVSLDAVRLYPEDPALAAALAAPTLPDRLPPVHGLEPPAAVNVPDTPGMFGNPTEQRPLVSVPDLRARMLDARIRGVHQDASANAADFRQRTRLGPNGTAPYWQRSAAIRELRALPQHAYEAFRNLVMQPMTDAQRAGAEEYDRRRAQGR